MPRLNPLDRIDIDGQMPKTDQEIMALSTKQPGDNVRLTSRPWRHRYMRIDALEIDRSALRVYVVATGRILGPTGKPGKQRGVHRWLVNTRGQ